MLPLAIYFSPVNIFKARGLNLDEYVLNNRSPRGMNRYASGAPGERSGVMTSFETYAEGNWLADRAVGKTHHTAVMMRNDLSEQYSYGFSLIKLNDNFVQLKFSSTSLNTKEGAYVSHSFSRATHSNKSGFHPGTTLMPEDMQTQLMVLLRSPPYSILHIAASQD
ncbi:hypothetical protein D9M71_350720 [compost metagenome]